MSKLFIFLIALISSQHLLAQFNSYCCGEKNSKEQDINALLNISSDNRTQATLDKMCDKFGIYVTIEAVMTSEVENCQAKVINGMPFVYFNPQFLLKAETLSFSPNKLPRKEDWATMAVLAHELGHLFNYHHNRLLNGETLKTLELEADEFSGQKLAELGATLEQAISAFDVFNINPVGTHSHPARAEREKAIEKGWRKGRNLLVKVEVPVEVEKVVEVEKLVEVEVPVEVEKIVEVEKLVEIEVPVEVEKIVEVEKLVEVEVPVEVEKIVEVEKEIQVPVPKVMGRKDLPIEQEMVLVEGGVFKMGNNKNGGDEKPEREIEVSSFWIDKYEVTTKQYCDFLNELKATYEQVKHWVDFDHKNCKIEMLYDQYFVRDNHDNFPMVKVSWQGAIAFAQYYGKRLPTEAEWEFAAKGGQLSKGYTIAGSENGNETCWHSNNIGRYYRAVGMKKPNELGIFDMSGNVWEWCLDWYGKYDKKDLNNPKGPESKRSDKDRSKVIRGGSRKDRKEYCSVTNRSRHTPANSLDNLGFRCIKELR